MIPKLRANKVRMILDHDLKRPVLNLDWIDGNGDHKVISFYADPDPAGLPDIFRKLADEIALPDNQVE